eukprot:349826_1
MFFIENNNHGRDKYRERFVVVGECIPLPTLFATMNQYSSINLKKKEKIMIPKLYERYAQQHENVDVYISSHKIKSYGFQFRNINDTIQNSHEFLFSRSCIYK